MVSETQYPNSSFQPKVGRVTLIERNSSSLSFTELPKYSLTILNAPTGFGKTALMSQWFKAARDEKISAVWLNIKCEDLVIADMLFLLVNSLTEAGIKLKINNIDDPEQTIGAIVCALESYEKPLYWFWDSFDHLAGHKKFNVIEKLVDSLPENVKLVIATRIDPNWSRIDFLIQDRVCYLTRNELRFSLVEIKQIFDNEGIVELNEHQLYKIASYTDGWPAAIKLAAIGIKAANTASEIDQILKAEFKLFSQFIEKNILGDLDEILRTFIARVSHLNILNADLCNKLCAIGDSEIIMKELEARGLLFDSKISETFFSFPQFIKVYLQNNFRSLNGNDADNIRSKTVAWYSEHKIPSEALYHALSFSDLSPAIDVVAIYGEELIISGEMTLLKTFFDRFPEDDRNARLGFLYVYIWILIIMQKFFEANEALKIFKEGLKSGSTNRSLERMVPDMREVKVVEYRIKQALDKEWSDPSVWIKLKRKKTEATSFLREQVELSLGAAYLRKENFSEAYAAFMEAARYAKYNNTPITLISALSKMAFIRNIEGRLSEALSLCNDAIDLSMQKFGMIIPVAAVPILIRSEIQYELGHLQKSEKDHFDATRLFEKYKSDKFQLQALIHGAKLINFYQGAEDAIKALDSSKVIILVGSDKKLQQHVRAEQVKYLLQNGEIARAESILMQEGISVDVRNPSHLFNFTNRNEAIYSAFCRYLTAIGRSASASAWLMKMLHRAQEQGRVHFCLEVSGLLALAHAGGDDESRTMRSVREMLLYGERIGSVQSILEINPDIIDLIKKYQGQQVGQMETCLRGPSDIYIQRLINHSSKLVVEADIHGPMLNDIKSLNQNKGKMSKEDYGNLLTAREVEVLTLISDGHSNKNIANELILGEGTVKWHVKNIFSKLYVTSRTQAASVGRTMGIVE